MTVVKQLAPQKREALAILSAARPFLTTAAEITIRGHRIQPWLSSTTTRNAYRSSPTPPRPDRDTARLVSRRIRAQTTARTIEALPRSGKGPDSPMRTPRTHRSRVYSPASLSANSSRAAARSSGLRSKSRAAHAIALLVTNRQCRPFSEIASSRNSGVCPEIFFSGRIVPKMLHAGITRSHRPDPRRPCRRASLP